MQHGNRVNQFNRNRFYTLLRVAKAELGWDDEFYYGIFLPSVGASKVEDRYSATTLTNMQLFTAVERLKDKGFKVKSKNGNVKASDKAKDRGVRLADDAQSNKIRALWKELHKVGKVKNPEEGSLLAYVKRSTGIERMEWLSTHEASNLIERLKQWLKRPAKK